MITALPILSCQPDPLPLSSLPLRSLKMPPEAIRDVLEGVLTVLNQQDTSWNNMKKFLGQKSVRDDIIEYDARKITPEIRAKVDKLLAQKGNSFQEAVIYRVSVAAAPLAAWVKANMSYSKVLEKVAPLENELQGLKDRLEESGRLIIQYEKELKECDEAVATLKTDFSKKTSVAETLRAGLEKAEGTVNAARFAFLLSMLSFLLTFHSRTCLCFCQLDMRASRVPWHHADFLLPAYPLSTVGIFWTSSWARRADG